MSDESRKRLSDDSIISTPRGRRSLLQGLIATTATALAIGTVEEAAAQGCTDSDPRDIVGRGVNCSRRRTGLSDQDPRDAAGYGYGRGPRTGVTDRDSGDFPGYGRGPAGPTRPTGITDRDPMDRANYGRGGR